VIFALGASEATSIEVCSGCPGTSSGSTSKGECRATETTVYLLNGGLLEYAQQMQAHESAHDEALRSPKRSGRVDRSVKLDVGRQDARAKSNFQHDESRGAVSVHEAWFPTVELVTIGLTVLRPSVGYLAADECPDFCTA
jgi:hypothetical protein